MAVGLTRANNLEPAYCSAISAARLALSAASPASRVNCAAFVASPASEALLAANVRVSALLPSVTAVVMEVDAF